MGLQVYKDSCKNCLLSKDRIVSPAVAKGIVKDCIAKQTHFFCHKSTIEGAEIVCKTFFDKFGHYSQMVRIAGRLNCLEFVEQTDSEKLMSYNEQHKK